MLRFSIGDVPIMMAGEFPEIGCEGPHTIGGTPVSLVLYMNDVDSFVKRAAEAGAKSARPMETTCCGDRGGYLADSFGQE